MGPRVASRNFVTRCLMSNGVRLERKGKLGLSTSVSATPRSARELEAEVDRLRRELASAKVDNEILKKAAAYFAKESR
jgi:transposase